MMGANDCFGSIHSLFHPFFFSVNRHIGSPHRPVIWLHFSDGVKWTESASSFPKWPLGIWDIPASIADAFALCHGFPRRFQRAKLEGRRKTESGNEWSHKRKQQPPTTNSTGIIWVQFRKQYREPAAWK
jgi:hypothetical protein